MNKLKSKKGITLVALVVTTVVLLILAGVSINAVLGDNGIITKAKEAAEVTKRASAEEEMNRLVLEYQLAKSDENFEDFLQEKINEGRINGATDNGDGTVTISKRADGKDYTITVKKPSSSAQSIKIKGKRVVANEDGTGENLGDASTRKGTTLYIMIDSSISGGTTTVSPEVPYAVTKNGTYTFTVTGTVNGKSYTKNVSVTVKQFKDVYEYMQTNTKVTYLDGEVWVPEGFRISADSAETVQGGIVIEDKDLNQFVWVPVATIADYKRTAYSINVATEETDTETNSTKIYYDSNKQFYYTEALPEAEKTSVERYKGFYIGRYEAGDKENTEAKKLRSSNDITKTVTIKCDQTPYNYVTRTQAISLAEGFATKQGYKAKTKLVSSYAWDTTIAFLQKTVSNYGNSSLQGNYNDTTFEYVDITTGNNQKQNKVKGVSTLVITGQTAPVCNIYDMGGNVIEWTSESCAGNNSYTVRGGNFTANYASYPAGNRFVYSNSAHDNLGFRLALFM